MSHPTHCKEAERGGLEILWADARGSNEVATVVQSHHNQDQASETIDRSEPTRLLAHPLVVLRRLQSTTVGAQVETPAPTIT